MLQNYQSSSKILGLKAKKEKLYHLKKKKKKEKSMIYMLKNGKYK